MTSLQRALLCARSRMSLALGLALSVGLFGGTAAVAAAPRATVDRVDYQLHMVFFSHEAGLSTVIDPQMFVASPGTPAGVGPQGIVHVAGVAPAPMADAPGTPLLNADGCPWA